MLAPSPIGHDALLLTLAALAQAGAKKNPSACRKQRRRAVESLESVAALPAIRAEAIRGIERSCGACRGCRGV